MKKTLEESIQKNFREINDGMYVTTTRDGDCFAVTTRPRSMPLHKKQDNYVLEVDEVDENYRIRKLTPVECERLQAFPDDWTKLGKDDEEISNAQRYKTVGNAVTTSVITVVVNNMFKKIK